MVQEVPGVNSQGTTRDEVLENLASALQEALELNRAEALAAAKAPYEEVSIEVLTASAGVPSAAPREWISVSAEPSPT